MAEVPACRQLVRYAIVGIAVNTLAYVSFLGMIAIGLHYQVAATLMFPLAMAASYGANRCWSFEYRGAISRSLADYIALYIGAWLLNLLVLWICVDLLRWRPAIVQAAAIVCIAGLIFLGQRYWVFRRRIAKTSDEASG